MHVHYCFFNCMLHCCFIIHCIQSWFNFTRAGKFSFPFWFCLAQTFPIVCFCLEIVCEAVLPATPQIPQNRGVPNITATSPHKSFNSHITEQRKTLLRSALSVLLARRGDYSPQTPFPTPHIFPPLYQPSECIFNIFSGRGKWQPDRNLWSWCVWSRIIYAVSACIDG